eukprot:s735_g1.t1
MPPGLRREPEEVHTLWIGEVMPEWVPRCVESYLATGHMVHWWSLEPQFDAERDANEIVSYSVAKTKHDSMILWAYWVVFQRFPYIVTALDKKLLYPRQGHR